jgi:2-polyprenyl-3-methyl-5-hydroxy-6-metoxy-1,4-benzoquinol methylase
MKPLKSLMRRASHRVSRWSVKASFVLARKVLTIPPEGVGDLLLFQYNAGNARFFLQTIGRVPIRLSQSPHCLLAKETVASATLADGPGQAAYRAFLEASWSALPRSPQSSVHEKVQSFWSHTKAVQEGKAALDPIIVVRMPGSDGLYIVDGNHRASIALALGRSIKAYLVPLRLVFFRYLASPEYYGVGHKGIPYQTIYHCREPIILGRRTDIFERLDLVPREVIAGASVLDVGSNLGMNALAAAWYGASTVLGLERSVQLTNAATRFSVLNNLYPSVTFRQFDVDGDTLEPQAQFDICFLFSIFRHVRDSGRLADIVANHVRKWVIFEGHPDTSYRHYQSFFEGGLFADVAQIGKLKHSAADPLTRPRPLWLCARAGRAGPP